MHNSYYLSKFELYLLTYARYSSNTCLAYSRDIQQFSDFCDTNSIRFKDLNAISIKDYLSHMYNKGLAASSRARNIESLRKFFEYLHEHHEFPLWSDMLISPQIPQRLRYYLNEADIDKLMNIVDQASGIYAIRNRVMIYLLYGTGIRISELLHIKVSDISFNPLLIRIFGKGSKERIVGLPNNCASLLKEHIDNLDTQYLFPGRIKGTTLTRQQAAYIVKTIAKKAGLDTRVYPHMMRHSYATHMLERGANIRQIQTVFGHARLSSTEIYTHVTMSHKRKVYNEKHLRA